MKTTPEASASLLLKVAHCPVAANTLYNVVKNAKPELLGSKELRTFLGAPYSTYHVAHRKQPEIRERPQQERGEDLSFPSL